MSEQWQIGKKKDSNLVKGQERAVLVGLSKKRQQKELVKEYLDELEFLALTAGAKTVKVFIQQMEHPHPRTFIGEGKAEEIAEYILSLIHI